MTKHPQIEVPSLHVCKLMQSLRSREVVKEKFNWCVDETDSVIESRRSMLPIDLWTADAHAPAPAHFSPVPGNTCTTP